MGFYISIDEKTKNWLAKKGNVITISGINIKNCCVPIEDVSVRYGKPDNHHMYDEVKSHGLSFFIEKGLNFKNDVVKIRLSGFAPFQTIRVEGLIRF